MKSNRRMVWLMTVFAAMILGSLVLGVHTVVSAQDLLDRKLKGTKLLQDVMHEIEINYVDEDRVSPEELFTAAIKGMVSSLDKHSVYLEPDEAKEFNDQTQGEFQGLGIEIGSVRGWLTVTQVLPGTPAEAAGLKTEDRIIEVEGESTLNMSLFEATKRLKGPSGTVVNLKVARRGQHEFLTIPVKRGFIHPDAINKDTAKMLDTRTGYVRLEDFTMDAAEELAGKITELQNRGMDGLVLDLRGNFGGLLDVAVKVCDLFIEKDKLIVSYRARQGMVKNYTSENDPLGDFLLAVLVDEYTASASEIVAGCVQDWKRGIIVGSGGGPSDKEGRTYGKGSVQTLIPLESLEGAQLKLTTAKYYTPLERSIHDMKGVLPDVLAPVTPAQHVAIRLDGLYGKLPGRMIATDLRLPEPEEDVTVQEIFTEADGNGDDQDELYDLELYCAYQHLNSARVTRRGMLEGGGLARLGN